MPHLYCYLWQNKNKLTVTFHYDLNISTVSIWIPKSYWLATFQFWKPFSWIQELLLYLLISGANRSEIEKAIFFSVYKNQRPLKLHLMQHNISLSAIWIAHNLPDFYNQFLYIWKKSKLKALLAAVWQIYGAFTNDLVIAKLKSQQSHAIKLASNHITLTNRSFRDIIKSKSSISESHVVCMLSKVLMV